MRKRLLVQAALAGLAALPMAGCIPGMRQSYRFPQEIVDATFPASDLTSLTLDAGTGDVEIVGETGREQVDVVVRLRSQDAERLARVCVPESRLEVREDLGTLSLALRQDSQTRCGETWSVRVPARFTATLTGGVTGFRVSGVLAHLAIRASGPGSVSGDVASNSVAIDLRHGSVDLGVTASAFGDAEARSDNGSASLSLDGVSVPSRSHPPGARVAVQGTGATDISIRSGLGDARLRLARPR